MPTLADLGWPRRTDRLLIRPATDGDTAARWAFRRLPEVSEWLGTAWADEAAFSAWADDPANRVGQLVVELDGTVVGDAMVETRSPWSQTEVADQARGVEGVLAWNLDPAVQGHGYATEVGDELLAIAFDGLGLRRVVAECFAENLPSRRVMERLGMRLENHNVRDSLHRDRGWLDGVACALLADEWRARPAAWAPPPRRPSLDDVAWPRRTERLLVRRATADDTPAVWAWSDDPRVSEWETSAHDDEASFAARWADPARLPVRLVVEEAGAVVGELMLLVRDGEGQAEVAVETAGSEGVIGWSFAAAVHGRGLATEAAADLLSVAFDGLGLRRVVASCFADNVSSWRVMEKLGMRREQHVVAGARHRTRGWLDGYGYALLATEWRERRRT